MSLNSFLSRKSAYVVQCCAGNPAVKACACREATRTFAYTRLASIKPRWEVAKQEWEVVRAKAKNFTDLPAQEGGKIALLGLNSESVGRGNFRGYETS